MLFPPPAVKVTFASIFVNGGTAVHVKSLTGVSLSVNRFVITKSKAADIQPLSSLTVNLYVPGPVIVLVAFEL
ncbi:hypothetical protein D3C85_1390630 [compost metagenome]